MTAARNPLAASPVRSISMEDRSTSRLSILATVVGIAAALAVGACSSSKNLGEETPTTTPPGPMGGMVTNTCTPACMMGQRCIAGACEGCGGPNQPCCGGGGAMACQMGNACVGAADGQSGLCRACGGSAQPCCPGGAATACTAPLRCVNAPGDAPNTCGMCGARGQACCVGMGMNNANACDMGSVCMAGMCNSCGGPGEPCCPGGGANACQAPLACVNGVMGAPDVCGTCGGPEQPCCAGGNACQAGNTCTDNVCKACGTMGLACCPVGMGGMMGAVRCQVPLVCGNTAGPDTCIAACGGPGQPCCVPNNTCAAGNICNAPGMGAATTCEPCGAAMQLCCAMDTCTAPSRCIDVAGLPNRCGACGGADQECCVGPSPCNQGLLCVNPGMNMQAFCRACGADNQACCANGVCNAGLGCDDPPGAVPGTCRSTCGAAGATCCLGNNCQPQLRCLGAGAGVADAGVPPAQTCMACGGPGQRCCASGPACRASTVCVGGMMNGTCQACGMAAQPCCEDNVCAATLTCRVPTGTNLPMRCEPALP